MFLKNARTFGVIILIILKIGNKLYLYIADLNKLKILLSNSFRTKTKQ
jgi:hypothetical protein